MKILVTGRGTSGSWAIRGQQLGAAIGATVQANASTIAGFDLCVVVKRAPSDLLHRIRAAKVPIVYDVVDSWPQPTGNEWARDECMSWLRQNVGGIKPVALVCATQAQATDCVEFGLPVLALPHHARPHQQPNPIRERVSAVGYEGAEHYLGRWREWVQRECVKRKWRFVINPPSLSSIDIVVALRAAHGYAARRWKSAVKLANAQGSGTPCIADSEASHLETASGGEVWADDPTELADALTELTPQSVRQAAALKLKARTLTLERIAEEYGSWLRRLNF